MYEPLKPVRVEQRGKGRVRLHLKGKVKVTDILEAVKSRAGWISLEDGWIDLYPTRAKRFREIAVKGPMKEILALGPDRVLPTVRKIGPLLEFAGVEKFRLQRARSIIGFICDFSLGLLYKPPPEESRKHLRVSKRVSGPKKTPSAPEPSR